LSARSKHSRSYAAPDRAIRDGNLVSGFAWSAHPQFLALFLEVLGTRVSL
jgi:protease I